MMEGTPFIPPLPNTPSNMGPRTPYSSSSARGLQSPNVGHQGRAPWEQRTPHIVSAAGSSFPPPSPIHVSQEELATLTEEQLAHDPRFVNVAAPGAPPVYCLNTGPGPAQSRVYRPPPLSPSPSSSNRPLPGQNNGPWDAASATSRTSSHQSHSSTSVAPPPPAPPPIQNPYSAGYPSPYISNPYAAQTPYTPYTPYGPPPGAWPPSGATPWGQAAAPLPPSPWAQAAAQPPPNAFTAPGHWPPQQQQYTPFTAPNQPLPWGAPPPGPPQASPWGVPPPAAMPGGWPQWGPQPGWGAPPPAPPPIAEEMDLGRPLAKASQPPVGDRIDKWAEGANYGPVLMSAEAQILGVTFEINPLMIPPSDDATEYLQWDMVFQTSFAHLTSDPPNVSWQRGRNQPATFPRVSTMRLVSKTLPYNVDIFASYPEIGVTCGDIIETLGSYLYTKASREEYELRLPKSRQQEVAMAYHRNRSRDPDVPGGRLSTGLLKLDVLGKFSMFGGIQGDRETVLRICGAEMPATFELVCGRKMASSEQEVKGAQKGASAAAASLRPSHSRSASRNSVHSSHSRRSRVETVTDEDD